MNFRFPFKKAIAGLGLWALTALPVHAQYQQPGFAQYQPWSNQGCTTSPTIPYQPSGIMAQPGASAGIAGSPSAQQQPSPDQQQQQQQDQQQDNANERSGALGGESVALADSNVGYIDSAIPRTQMRMIFDAAYGNNRPDRAEFFYAKCGCFNFGGIPAAGPLLTETKVDYQELTSYLEWAPTKRFSTFLELPWRFINPEQNGNANGFGDIRAGFKAAFLYCEDRVGTFQVRGFAPTGEPTRGLGTDHYTVEPALLWYEKLSKQLFSESEFRVWVPIGGSDFSGEVIRYGTGLSYLLVDAPSWQFSPVAEVVGWTMLNGKELAALPFGNQPILATVVPVGGQTIVNAKIGARIGFGGRQEGPGASTMKSDLYIGYGRALTGDFWYKDILRLEYRVRF